MFIVEHYISRWKPTAIGLAFPGLSPTLLSHRSLKRDSRFHLVLLGSESPSKELGEAKEPPGVLQDAIVEG